MIRIAAFCLLGIAAALQDGKGSADVAKVVAEAQELRAKEDYASASKALEGLVESLEKGAEKGADLALAKCVLGSLYRQQGAPARAEPLLKDSLALREQKFGPESLEAAETLLASALVSLDLDRFGDAARQLDRCLRVRESRLGADDPGVAEVLSVRAQVKDALGDYAGSKALLEKSLKIHEAKLGPDDPALARTLLLLGWECLRLGDAGAAETNLERSRKIRESRLGSEHSETAFSVLRLSSVYDHEKQFKKAESTALGSLNTLEARLGPDHPTVALGLLTLGNIYTHERYFPKAVLAYDRAIRIFEAAYRPACTPATVTRINLAGAKDMLGDAAAASALYTKVLHDTEATFGENHPQVAIALQHLHSRSVIRNQVDDAEAYARRAEEILKTLGLSEDSIQIKISERRAEGHAARKEWAEAAASFDRARRLSRRYCVRVLGALPEREQLTYLQSEQVLLMNELGVSMGLLGREDPVVAALSASWVINFKGLVQETLSQRTVLSRESADPGTRETAAALAKVREELAAAVTGARDPAGDAATVRDRILGLRDQEAKLSKELGRLAGAGAVLSDWTELEDVRLTLPARSVLLEFRKSKIWVWPGTKHPDTPYYADPGGTHYLVWIIPPIGPAPVRVIDLGSEELIHATIDDAFLYARRAPRPGKEKDDLDDTRRALAALSRRVLQPVLEACGDVDSLIISPDSGLWLVPWGALPLPDGKLAIERYSITTVTTGRDLVGLPKGPAPSAPVIMADPDFNGGKADLGPRAIPRLPGTAKEAEGIAPYLKHYAGIDPKVYLGKEAQEGRFKALKNPRVLVLCTHAFYKIGSRENPLLRTGLLLAGAAAPEEARAADGEDGTLTSLEVLGTDLRGTELAVLSACETGRGKMVSGEGVEGLRQAFQLAGARTVVSTLWKIPDRETAELTTRFFKGLSEGETKSAALRNAQLSMLARTEKNPDGTHPFFWAAFTLTGDPR